MDNESEKLVEAAATKAVEHAPKLWVMWLMRRSPQGPRYCERSSEQQNDVLVS